MSSINLPKKFLLFKRIRKTARKISRKQKLHIVMQRTGLIKVIISSPESSPDPHRESQSIQNKAATLAHGSRETYQKLGWQPMKPVQWSFDLSVTAETSIISHKNFWAQSKLLKTFQGLLLKNFSINVQSIFEGHWTLSQTTEIPLMKNLWNLWNPFNNHWNPFKYQLSPLWIYEEFQSSK